MVRPLLESPGCGAVVSVPPPPHFRPLRPPISRPQIRITPYERSKGDTDAREAGLRYEERIQTTLMRKVMGYLAEPHLHFYDESGARTLRPDGLLIDLDLVKVFEIKSQHMPEAWWQLDRLYKPVLFALYKRPIVCVEIVKSFDPAMPFPVKFDLIESYDQMIHYKGEFGVFQW